jgi:hypothetical protein
MGNNNPKQDLYNACLGMKTALLLGVEGINLQQAEKAAMVYRVDSSDFLKAWGLMYRSCQNGKLIRNRDIPDMLRENGL